MGEPPDPPESSDGSDVDPAPGMPWCVRAGRVLLWCWLAYVAFVVALNFVLQGPSWGELLSGLFFVVLALGLAEKLGWIDLGRRR